MEAKQEPSTDRISWRPSETNDIPTNFSKSAADTMALVQELADGESDSPNTMAARLESGRAFEGSA